MSATYLLTYLVLQVQDIDITPKTAFNLSLVADFIYNYI